ncbi:MAG: DUF1858 domain-containing protein [Deferribacteraceae bacterium]|jgi:hybrid cluster-associated redox disulfide protein|nr:DUF1858 domain-containing protein [Deferribacteraceae bacterium]
MQITKDSLLKDIIKADKDRVLGILGKYNMGCASCSGIQSESLEKAAIMHGLDVNALVDELRGAI